ncbi:hypothetical protein KFE98_17735 [bacterium SCSIO 12741]|nr:hypothetical protein KFE98_17735 [bacterium SCSIO 12741]
MKTNLIFELLDEMGLSETSFPDKVMAWNIEEFNDFHIRINEAIAYSKNRNTVNQYSFIANTQMSGGPDPCAMIDCRHKNLDLLARNTLLYADKVYLQNWFERSHEIESINDEQKISVANSIGLLHYVRPLLEKGYFEICSSEHHFCPSCYQELLDSGLEDFEKKIDRLEKYLVNKYLKKGVYTLEEKNGHVFIVADGPSNLFEHPAYVHYTDQIPKGIIELLESGSKVELKKKESLASGIINFFVNQIIEDLQYQDYYGKVVNSNYLTTREIDFKALSKINSNKTNNLNEKVLSSLSHSVPYVLNSELSSLVELREKEGESFQVYRNSMATLSKDLRKETDEKVQQALKDVIEPEILKINRSIKNSKSLLKQDLSIDVLIGSCFVGVGLFSGIVPANIGPIIAGIGGVDFLNKVTKNVVKLNQDPPQIRENNFYFLWKASQHGSEL